MHNKMTNTYPETLILEDLGLVSFMFATGF